MFKKININSNHLAYKYSFIKQIITNINFCLKHENTIQISFKQILK